MLKIVSSYIQICRWQMYFSGVLVRKKNSIVARLNVCPLPLSLLSVRSTEYRTSSQWHRKNILLLYTQIYAIRSSLFTFIQQQHHHPLSAWWISHSPRDLKLAFIHSLVYAEKYRECTSATLHCILLLLLLQVFQTYMLNSKEKCLVLCAAVIPMNCSVRHRQKYTFNIWDETNTTTNNACIFFHQRINLELE